MERHADQTLAPGSAQLAFGREATERLLIAAFLLASGLFLFVDSRTVPIILWDESRNVVNALEMHLSGFSLITTYEFRPDLWNTKPPLLIWLMTLSTSLFGPSEWALRLPSALAALATLLCLILFVRRLTGSIGTGLLAAALLVLSPGFFGEHGARTADYDMVLLFFVTSALQLLFFAVHRQVPSRRLLIGIGGLAALAAMTKSIAAFIPLTGVLLYLVVTGRWWRVWKGWRAYALAGTLALGPLLMFYAAREAVAPGYLAAVLHNDMGGRFSQVLTGVQTGPFYYVSELFLGWFFAGPLLLAIPFALRQASGRTRLLIVWSLCVSAGTLLTYSISSTRLIHYALPAFPWLAVAAALSLRLLAAKYIAQPWRTSNRPLAMVAGAALLLLTAQLCARAAHWRYEAFPQRQFPAQALYGEVFAQLAGGGVKQVIAVDPGFVLEGTPGYIPLLRANALIWRDRNLRVHHSAAMPARRDLPMVSCEPAAGEFWRRAQSRSIGGCALLPAGEPPKG